MAVLFAKATIISTEKGACLLEIDCVNGKPGKSEVKLADTTPLGEMKEIAPGTEFLVMVDEDHGYEKGRYYPFVIEKNSDQRLSGGGVGKGHIQEGMQDPFARSGSLFGEKDDSPVYPKQPAVAPWWVNGTKYSNLLMNVQDENASKLAVDTEVLFHVEFDEKENGIVTHCVELQGNCLAIPEFETNEMELGTEEERLETGF